MNLKKRTLFLFVAICREWNLRISEKFSRKFQNPKLMKLIKLLDLN